MPLTQEEKGAEDDIQLLEDIARAADEVWPPEPEPELTTEELIQMDSTKIYERLQKRMPILLVMSSRRLERLTRWLIVLTLALAVLTVASFILRFF
ncbi:MAG: hypothetical protein JRN59_07790 [Nitrososphaerota archaeon]|nr:hypothetical protein [Nitrososphaerota archaeon]